MALKRLGQAGFSAIEAVLILVIIGILGGTSYYVYHANHNATATLNSSSKVAQTSPAKTVKTKKASVQHFFKISEWNVQAPYDGSLSLEYQFFPSTGALNPYSYAMFSAKQLDATAPQCASSIEYAGSIARYAADQHYLVGDGGIDSGKTAAETATEMPAGSYGHVGNYYFFYTSPQAACGDSQASQDAQKQTIATVQGLLAKLEAIK